MDDPGVRRLLDDLADLSTPAQHAPPPCHDANHVPLRWRLLVVGRDDGASWDELGRILGVSPQAAEQAYRRWAPRMCCRERHDT